MAERTPTPGEWMIGRGNIIVAKPPDGCQCESCVTIRQYAEQPDTELYGGHFLCESIQNGADAQLFAQAKRLYEAGKALLAARAGTAAEQFDAFAEMIEVIKQCECIAIQMPPLPRPVRPAYPVK